MKIAAIQSDIAWEDPAANFQRLAPQVASAAASGARLVILPEMYACGFSMATARIEEPVGGPSTTFLQDQARAHGLWICGSLPERREGTARPANTLVLAGPTGELHRYRKIHPFRFAGEHEHYDAGDAFLTVTIEGLRCTFFICYDLRFADEFWVTATATDAYVVVANWPARRRHHWTTLARARAIENQAYVVAVNRVGEGGGLEYSGDTSVHDPWGEALATAAGQEVIVYATLDPAVVADARSKFPVLPDRRPFARDGAAR
ncbi:MAG: carbon-nitrogen family hydrolase [Myxococcales bacterium]|nr:carbon-nitrogen family hydrolase [Myxococcales bacterium]